MSRIVILTVALFLGACGGVQREERIYGGGYGAFGKVAAHAARGMSELKPCDRAGEQRTASHEKFSVPRPRSRVVDVRSRVYVERRCGD